MTPDNGDTVATPSSRGGFFAAVIALFMAVILPGFGQLYNAQWNKALWVFLAFCLSTLFLMALNSLWVPDRWLMTAMALSLAGMLLSWAVGVLDAVWHAWRRPHGREPWQTLPVYTVVLLFAYFGVFKAGGGYVRRNLVEPFRIPSESMAPGLTRGDFLFADKRVNCPGCRVKLRHGDVALFVYPDNRNVVFIKRIIGMPGDTIEIEGTEVRRNGRALTIDSEEFDNGRVEVSERGSRGAYQVAWNRPDDRRQTIEVPHGQVLVMGDNRSASQDSRRFGTIPMGDVIGVARQTWLSVSDRLEIRWERMGRTIR